MYDKLKYTAINYGDLEIDPTTGELLRRHEVPMISDGNKPMNMHLIRENSVLVPQYLSDVYEGYVNSGDGKGLSSFLSAIKKNEEDRNLNSVGPEDYQNFNKWFSKYTMEGRRGVKPNDPELDYDHHTFWMDLIKKHDRGEITQDELKYQLTADIHGPDTYKRPNHPTYSDESMYFDDEIQPGTWDKEVENTFHPSESQVKKFGKDFYKEYEKQVGDKIAIDQPAEYPKSMDTYLGRNISDIFNNKNYLKP